MGIRYSGYAFEATIQPGKCGRQRADSCLRPGLSATDPRAQVGLRAPTVNPEDLEMLDLALDSLSAGT